MNGETSSSFPSIDRDFYNVVGVPNSSGSPERRLLLAVLERAILDYVGNDTREVHDAEEWIFGDLEEANLERFSFPWICEQLDLNLHKIAAMIRSMPRRGKNRVAPWYFAKEETHQRAMKSKDETVAAVC